MTSPYVNHEYRQQQLDHDLVQCSAHVSWETGRVVWPISITWTHASSLRPKPPPSRWTSLTDGRPSSVTSATCASMYYLLPKEWMRPASFKDIHILTWDNLFAHVWSLCSSQNRWLIDFSLFVFTSLTDTQSNVTSFTISSLSYLFLYCMCIVLPNPRGYEDTEKYHIVLGLRVRGMSHCDAVIASIWGQSLRCPTKLWRPGSKVDFLANLRRIITVSKLSVRHPVKVCICIILYLYSIALVFVFYCTCICILLYLYLYSIVHVSVLYLARSLKWTSWQI